MLSAHFIFSKFIYLNAFCRKMERVLPQNGMRFAAKWNAFCRKMESVLPQNGKRFGPKWKKDWPKTGCVLGQNIA